jgi:hypothetical protein
LVVFSSVIFLSVAKIVSRKTRRSQSYLTALLEALHEALLEALYKALLKALHEAFLEALYLIYFSTSNYL